MNIMNHPPGTGKTESVPLAVGTAVWYKDAKHDQPTKHFIKEISAYTDEARKGQAIYSLENEVGTIVQEGGVKKFLDRSSFELYNEAEEIKKKAKNMKPEDLEAIENEDRTLEAEEEAVLNEMKELEKSIPETQAKIEALESEGKEDPKAKQTTIDKKKEEIKKLLEESKTEQGQKIEDSRKKYITAYGAAVKDVNPFVKMSHKLGNWLGTARKDAFTDSNEKTLYEKQKNLRGDKTLDIFAEKRVLAREAERKNQNPDYSEKTPLQIKALRDRYKKMISNTDTKEEKIAKIEKTLAKNGKESDALKKLIEVSGGKEKFLKAYADSKKNEAFSNQDFDFVKNENTTLRTEQQAAWEAHKNRGERMMAKAGKMIEKNWFLRKTIGNKWARAALISGGVGFATGGILSPVFWANRVVSVAGGMTGGYFGGLIGGKIIKAQERLDKKQIELDIAYKQGMLTASAYDKGMQQIDLKRNQYARAKDAFALLGASAGGMTAQKIDNHVHLSSAIGNKAEQAWDWVKGKAEDYAWDVGEPDPGSGSTTVGGGHTGGITPDKGTYTPDTVPSKESIVEAGSGKGFEHSFRAQIEHDPALAAKLKELYHYQGDISTAEGLHKFSGVAAHQMALSEGYIGADGSERWIHGTMAPEISIEGNEVVIHERVLDHGKWVETETSTGTFETGADTDPSGHVYEKTHHAGHQGPAHAHHVEHLRKSIDQLYDRATLPHADLPNASLPTAELPHDQAPVRHLPTADLPQDQIKPQPTINVEQIRPQNHMPRTIGDPMHNTPGYFAEPNPQHGGILRNLFSKAGENMSEGQNMAMNSAPAGKDIFTIILEGFFGPETPSTPVVPNPLEGGSGPMTA